MAPNYEPQAFGACGFFVLFTNCQFNHVTANPAGSIQLNKKVK